MYVINCVYDVLKYSLKLKVYRVNVFGTCANVREGGEKI